MSPEDRLLSDRAAEILQIEAVAVLAGPLITSQAQNLAAAVVALARDRAARLELAAIEARR